jgi:hypothetical protein
VKKHGIFSFDWMDAYGRSGSGSTFIRANDLKEIYKDTLPVPDDIDLQRETVAKIYEILKLAIVECGGKIR